MTDSFDDLSQCRILLVDDVKDNINVLVETLKDDYRLGFALNGADALAFAKSQQPDLILLDIMMPVMDGYETCRRLKAEPATRDIPVLFITALDEIENKTAAFDVGAVDYIIKPFEITEIRARVRTHLTLKRARQTLAAQRDRLQQSLDLAMEVQQNLLPSSSEGFTGLEIAGKSVYCDETGGDYYDYIHMADGKTGIVVGDVAGHGIQSALLMTTVRGSLRQRILAPGGLADTVADLNRQFFQDVSSSGHFMTLFICEIDPTSGRVGWVRAGHDPALIFRHSGNDFTELSGQGVPLGVVENYPYQSSAQHLEEGELLVIGTDGIWEAPGPDGGRFGKDRFRDVIRSCARQPAMEIVSAVIEAVQSYSRPLKSEDDITLVVVRRTHG